jgi:hypothetical protein
VLIRQHAHEHRSFRRQCSSSVVVQAVPIIFKKVDSDPLTIEGGNILVYTVVCVHVRGTNSTILYSKKFIQTSHVQPDFLSHTDRIPIQVLIIQYFKYLLRIADFDK